MVCCFQLQTRQCLWCCSLLWNNQPSGSGTHSCPRQQLHSNNSVRRTEQQGQSHRRSDSCPDIRVSGVYSVPFHSMVKFWTSFKHSYFHRSPFSVVHRARPPQQIMSTPAKNKSVSSIWSIVCLLHIWNRVIPSSSVQRSTFSAWVAFLSVLGDTASWLASIVPSSFERNSLYCPSYESNFHQWPPPAPTTIHNGIHHVSVKVRIDILR